TRNATGPRDGVLERCWPASFAGTSRIRFGGSVAIATLSALDALPRGGARLWQERSTLPEPDDHVVDDLEALGLVVELVAKRRVRPPFDARRTLEHLTRGRRHEPVVEAVHDERRPSDVTSVFAHTRLLADGLGTETKGVRGDVQRIGSHPAAAPWTTREDSPAGPLR